MSKKKHQDDDPRNDTEFALLWAAMAEADWLDFTEQDGDEAAEKPLRLLLDARRRLRAERRRAYWASRKWILFVSVLAVLLALVAAAFL